MEHWKFLKRLCENILEGKFNDEKYRDRKSYYGVEIQTGPLFCSYGTIGFTVDVYGDEYSRISWDYETKTLLIEGVDYQTAINILWLKDNGFSPDADGTELEYYTSAGGDMIIYVEECTKAAVLDYMERFDINEEVALWWPNGCPGNGVPFDNMKEHYEDLEAWVEKVKDIAKDMPY